MYFVCFLVSGNRVNLVPFLLSWLETSLHEGIFMCHIQLLKITFSKDSSYSDVLDFKSKTRKCVFVCVFVCVCVHCIKTHKRAT